MSDLELIHQAKCPNKDGDLVLFENPPNIFNFLPEEIIELLIDNQERDPDGAKEIEFIISQTIVVGVCAKCGFALMTTGQSSSEGEKT